MVFQAIPNFRWHHGPAGSRYRCPAALEPRTGHRRFQISSIEGASHCRWPNCIPYYIPHMIYMYIYIHYILYMVYIYICIHIYISYTIHTYIPKSVEIDTLPNFRHWQIGFVTRLEFSTLRSLQDFHRPIVTRSLCVGWFRTPSNYRTFMYIYIYIGTYIYIHTYMHAYIHTYIYIYIHML